MNTSLHLHSVNFTKKLNDIAFNSNLKPSDVEKKYYFNLLQTKFLEVYPHLKLDITSDQFKSGFFSIDGKTQPVKESFWDWNCLCNYLYNNLKLLNLTFDFSQKESNGKTIISGVLYYNSVFDDQVKSISFDLLPASVSETDNDNSGGEAPLKTKIDEEVLKPMKLLPPTVVKQIVQQVPSKSFSPSKLATLLKPFKSIPANQIPKIFQNLKALDNITKSIVKNNPPIDLSKDSLTNQQITNSKILENSHQLSQKSTVALANQMLNHHQKTTPINSKQKTPQSPTQNPQTKNINQLFDEWSKELDKVITTQNQTPAPSAIQDKNQDTPTETKPTSERKEEKFIPNHWR